MLFSPSGGSSSHATLKLSRALSAPSSFAVSAAVLLIDEEPEKKIAVSLVNTVFSDSVQLGETSEETPATDTEDPAEGEPEPYGSTWWLRTGAHQPPYFRSLPKDTYWMSGHDGQRTVVVPSADLVVVRMGFSPTYADQDPRVEQLVRAAIDAT
mgnify:CR=1 FL=1